MFTEKHYPDKIEPEELDKYLARGWYRMGQTIFTTHFLFFKGNLYSAIWTRLPLEGYSFRKSLRKIIKKNERNFRIEVRPGAIDDEKEALFQEYKIHFPGFQSPSLDYYLMDGKTENVFNTVEACVYDGDKLIAFSFFDIGSDSISSIIGVYSPDYQSFSLGMYTMLLEIQYGLDHGFKWHYPGYIVPGRPKFEYKKRIGTPEEVQYFDLKSRNWHPMIDFNELDIPIRKITHKLGEIHVNLREIGIFSQLLYYPSYEIDIPFFSAEYRLDAPIFLNIFPNYFNNPKYVISYNIWQDTYSFCKSMQLEELAFLMGKKMEIDLRKHRRFLDAILKKDLIIESDDLDEIISMVWNEKLKLGEAPPDKNSV